MFAEIVFVFYIVFPLLSWFLKSRFVPSTVNYPIYFIIVLIIGSLLYVGGGKVVDYEYTIELNKFDLNNDGMFSDNEINPEQEAAMRKLVNDTGRNLIPIIAVPVTIIWTTIVYVILAMFSAVAQNIRNKT